MSKEFIVREFQPGDEAGIIETLKASFPGWNNTNNALDYWKWKYFDAPLKSFIIVSLNKGKIVGVNHDIKLNLKVGPAILLTTWGDDLSVLPEYRAMGLFGKMRKFRNERPEYADIKFKYSVTSNPIVKNDWIKRKLKIFPHNVRYMIRVKDIKLHIEKKQANNPLLTRAEMSLLKTLNRVKPKKNVKKRADYKLVEISSFNDDINDFWDKIKVNYNFILERKKDFMNWRFHDQALEKNKIIQALDGSGDILGYVALRTVSRDGYIEGYITDLLALPDRDDVIYDLQGEACDYFDKMGANIARVRCVEGHPYQEILEGNFMGLPGEELYLSYESLTGGNESEILEKSDKKEISLSYTETF